MEGFDPAQCGTFLESFQVLYSKTVLEAASETSGKVAGKAEISDPGQNDDMMLPTWTEGRNKEWTYISTTNKEKMGKNLQNHFYKMDHKQ